MREKILNILKYILVLLIGIGITYFVVSNPFNNKEKNNLSFKDSGYKNNVTIDNNGISSAVENVYDAVVLVENFKAGIMQGTGSGFVYKVDKEYGYIITNQHVVENSNSLKVMLTNGKEVDAELLGGDEYIDVAVLAIPVKSVISVAKIGNTKNLKLGDFIFAIGSPVGIEYFNSITSGIISGLNREVTVSINSTSDWVMKVIQVDAAINPGNSGGPLLNANGEVIGVNSMKLVDSQIEGMGFSIKIEDAMAHIDQIEAGKAIERPLLGITLTSASDSTLLYRYGIKLDTSVEYGAVVVEVMEGTGASKSDLKKGDVITAIEGEKVSNAAYLKYILYKYSIGDKIKVTYLREGKEKSTSVTLTKNKD